MTLEDGIILRDALSVSHGPVVIGSDSINVIIPRDSGLADGQFFACQLSVLRTVRDHVGGPGVPGGVPGGADKPIRISAAIAEFEKTTNPTTLQLVRLITPIYNVERVEKPK